MIIPRVDHVDNCRVEPPKLRRAEFTFEYTALNVVKILPTGS